MRKLLRTTLGLAAASALVFVWSPPSGADGNVYTAPVHDDPTAVCTVVGVVGITKGHGVNLHPTKNVYDFTADVDCVDLDGNDVTTLDGTFDVDVMVETTGITHTAAAPSTTGETCTEGHHTTPGAGTVTDTQAAHAGDVGAIHVYVQRLGPSVVAWGTIDLPTVGHKTFRATLTFVPPHLIELAACLLTVPGSTETTVSDHGTGGPMTKLTTLDVMGTVEVYSTESETLPSSSVPATLT
jgi:hypothetical protein